MCKPKRALLPSKEGQENKYLLEKENKPTRKTRKRLLGQLIITKPQVTDKLRVHRPMTPSLGPGAKALANSGTGHLIDFPLQAALKENLDSISPISISATDSLHFHSFSFLLC